MRSIVPLLVFTACSSSGPWGPQGGNEPFIALVCDASVTSVAWDEVTPLGFTADEAIAAIEGTTEGDVDIEGEPRAVMTLSVMAADGTLRFIDRFDPTTGDDSADCVDELEVPVTIMLSTDDGSFDIEVDSALGVAALDVYSVAADIGLEENLGGYSVQAPSPEITEQHFTFVHEVNADSGTGQLSLFEEGTDGQAMWATVDAIMTWPILGE